jgi:hypothetical protein
MQLRSFPLGFSPDDASKNHQILPEYASKVPTMKPETWPEAREIPNSVTEEVLKHWTANSLTRVEYPCRKIVFTIKSRDQGWGGSHGQGGTYEGSYTWFDVGMERMSATKES